MKQQSIRYSLMAGALAVLLGCSEGGSPEEEPRINLTGTQRDFEQSQEQLRESLGEEQRAIYDEAMRILYFRASDLRESGTLTYEEVESLLREQIHDRTAGEIVGEATATFRRFCEENDMPAAECDSSIEAAGLDSWN